MNEGERAAAQKGGSVGSMNCEIGLYPVTGAIGLMMELMRLHWVVSLHGKHT